MKDQFYAYDIGRCSAVFSGYPFIGLKRELLPFSILVGFHKIELSIGMYFQSIYIIVVVRIIKKELKVL